MSESLLEVPFLTLGPKIAIVDDSEIDARPLEDALTNLEISNHYFNVNLIDPQYPQQPLKDIEIVFMDLYFSEGFGVQFDPYLCIEWLRRIVPSGQRYVLVVWSRDADNYTSDLLDAIGRVDMTKPFLTDVRSKQAYRLADNLFDVPRLLEDIGTELQKVPTTVYEYIGQILEVDEDEVLINCRVDEEGKVFEVRRFDIGLFDNFIEPRPMQVIKIKVTNKPGSTTLDFFLGTPDLAEKFVKPDPAGLEDIEWPNFPDDEDNV